MKILFVNKFLYPNGGSETYIFELGKCLQKMGHEVQYFGMEHEGRIVGNSLNIYTSNMDFHASKLDKLKYPFKIIYSKEAAKKITAVLRDFKPDVVHFNNINFQLTPSVIEAVADYDLDNRCDTQIIVTAHDYQWVCPNHMLKNPSDDSLCFKCEGGHYANCIKGKCIHNSTLRSVLGAFEAVFYAKRETYGLADKIIAPSRFLMEKLETNPELKGKCVAMHNFLVNGDDKQPVSDEINEILTQKYVLYFGRFSKEKGIETLLKVCRNLPDINFVFAGNGSLKDEVDSIANIRDVGFRSGQELHELIKNAAFTVFPSEWYENCPFSVMESIQFGTPIIASDLGGTPELIPANAGELFTAGNENELTEKISRLWNDSSLRDKYHEGCSEADFDTVEEYANKLIEIYRGEKR